MYLPERRGAYKGMYLYVTEGAAVDSKIRATLVALRMDGYAAGSIRSYADADEAQAVYLKGKR